jgi:predicted ArsR family transcriptional regulator
VPTSQLDLLKTLGDNTRYAIYLELARASVPKTTAEISETLSLHPNTVRPHLERMREVGLLSVEVGGRGHVGRPQHRYSSAPDAPSLGLEPPTMPVLARMVLSMAQRLHATPDDAEAVGYGEGRNRAMGYRAAPSTLEALVADLDRLGFDPVVSDDPRVDPTVDDHLAAVVSFANCPTWSAACIAGSSLGSWPTWATLRSANSVMSRAAHLAESPFPRDNVIAR